MPAQPSTGSRAPFQYAVLRVIPSLERGEAMNAGVVVYCRPRRFLEARVSLDEGRLRALAPGADAEAIRERLDVLARVAAGDPSAGPIAAMEQSERFHWLAAPSSTVIQPGPVHTGLCDDPAGVVDRLFAQLVAPPDLGAMRQSYERSSLDLASLAPTWLEQFERWFGEVGRGELGWEPNAMVVSTADAAGRPSSRTVLLKGVDQHGFVFFTNLRSRKGRQLGENAVASIVFPWLRQERQVLVTGRVELLADAENDAYFASRPRGSQLSAAVSPQSEVIASRESLVAARDELERSLGDDGPVPRPPHWGGVRVIPETIEFWQGRRDRLHDRLRFRLDGAGWVVERLAP
ncbi:MAG TPA: pyridoxamine 5'-phosphate oxidase [Solirubrobacteraceae bacterium]|nr:pyridoxamine 5'-phosphate oxidase [Solirubrobacteraceae bacterium]